MQEYSVKVTLPDGQVMAVTASESDTLEAVADRFKDYYEDDIILGIVNGRLRELNKKIKSDCELSFVTTADRDGRRTYRRSVVLLLQRAIYDVYGSMTQLHVMHSLGEGYYCQLEKAVECADSQQEKYNEDTDGHIAIVSMALVPRVRASRTIRRISLSSVVERGLCSSILSCVSAEI